MCGYVLIPSGKQKDSPGCYSDKCSGFRDAEGLQSEKFQKEGDAVDELQVGRSLPQGRCPRMPHRYSEG